MRAMPSLANGQGVQAGLRWPTGQTQLEKTKGNPQKRCRKVFAGCEKDDIYLIFPGFRHFGIFLVVIINYLVDLIGFSICAMVKAWIPLIINLYWGMVMNSQTGIYIPIVSHYNDSQKPPK